jgi:hypothetical protein
MQAEAECQSKTAVAIITSILVEDPLIVGGHIYGHSKRVFLD